MKRKETVETVRRVREIHRRQSVPRTTVMVAYDFIHRPKRAERIFSQMRAGRRIRDYT